MLNHRSTLCDRALVTRYRAVYVQLSKLSDLLVDMGYGDLKPSDMRALKEPPKTVVKYLRLIDEAAGLRLEAEFRYGPGLIRVEQLVSKY